MNRRNFLHLSLLGSAVAMARPSMSTYRANPASELYPTAFELEEITISELQAGMVSGKLTARSIAEKYLERINALDKQGPAINSVLEINPEALEIADLLDRERKAKGPRSPMHGIPILVKDNIGSADRMMTTAGSLALVGSKPSQDAFIIQKLRAAGAVILGKTNLSEWANFRSTHATSGWSARGGQTRNPYVLDRNPCGSSSGSGSAVAANLCAAAIGTETDGSIVCPSSVNSLVGFKPTLGLVSRTGIIPLAHSQDTAGPMARTVADAALLLSAISGIDPRDPVTSEAQGKMAVDYTKFLDPNGLKGARIGVVRKFFGFNDPTDRVMNTSLEAMKRLGAILIDPVTIPTIGKFGDSEFEVLLYEFKADLNAYLAGLGTTAQVHSLKELIEFNLKNSEKEMPYFGQEIFIQAEAKGPLTSSAYQTALRKNHRLTRTEGIDAVMNKLRLDALVAPTEGPPCTTDLINGDHFSGSSSSLPAVAGYPHITVPAGYVFGLPVGLSFFGKAYSEPTLIKLAYAFEMATKVRRPPQFMPTAKLNT